jgi:hypothetical protein
MLIREAFDMDLVLEITEKAKLLDRHSQELVLGVISKILGEDEDDFLTDEDLQDIEIAEQEFARGEYVLHSQIKWKDGGK